MKVHRIRKGPLAEKMNTHNYLKYAAHILLLTGVVFWSCRQSLDNAASLQIAADVRVVDTSFVSQKVFQSSLVDGAEVVLSATSFNFTARSLTDIDGIARFSDLIPDYYNCLVSRSLPADTVVKYLPLKKEITLVGSQARVRLAQNGDSLRLIVKPVLQSDLLISEIYYNGAPPNPPYYFHDQFTEIYNNSSETIYLDHYAVGNVDYGFRDSDPDFLYCVHLYSFPGSGTDYPLEPGRMIIIAQDAINHTLINPNSLDLSAADFEYYNPQSNDVDVQGVPNMIQIHHKYLIDFLYSVMNDAIVLFKLEAEDSVWTYSEFNLIKVPVARAVDGAEYRESLREFEYKHLPDAIDAGITGGIPMYKGKSVARKIYKKVDGQIILMDTNNSGTDFQVLDEPTPGRIE